MITGDLPAGVIDVHAHWLPRELFGLPPGAPYGAMHDRTGELFLGELPLSIATEAMSDTTAIVADMRQAEVGVRVLSAPPFAFPMQACAESQRYTEDFNSALTDVVQQSDGRLLGLGMVSMADEAATTRQLEQLARTEGMVGVAIPPLFEQRSLDGPLLGHVLSEATRLGLSVLVHPMQFGRPEWGAYYLANLIGNPTETATAVAALILSGRKDELHGLRICFVHGGGCAPGLLGRWTHGWRTRADVSARLSRPPQEVFGDLYFDTVTHGEHQLALLCELAGTDKVVCGSDYPFDMAEVDPARFAIKHGPGEESLVRAARSFLGAS